MLDSLNKPLAVENFTLLPSMPAGKLFYGISLKTEFDKDKIQINSKYSPEYFYTIIKQNNYYCISYFYGSFLPVNKEYEELINNLNLFSQLPKDKKNLFAYTKILKIFNIDCDDVYLHFSRSLFPISPIHREKIFSKKIDFNNYFKGNNKYPFYLTIVSPIIFYFSDVQNNILDFQKFLIKNTKQENNLINKIYEGQKT